MLHDVHLIICCSFNYFSIHSTVFSSSELPSFNRSGDGSGCFLAKANRSCKSRFALRHTAIGATRCGSCPKGRCSSWHSMSSPMWDRKLALECSGATRRSSACPHVWNTPERVDCSDGWANSSSCCSCGMDCRTWTIFACNNRWHWHKWKGR